MIVLTRKVFDSFKFIKAVKHIKPLNTPGTLFKIFLQRILFSYPNIRNLIKVKHGKVNSICYIIDKKLAYISDVSKISEKDYKYFKNLNYLIIDCLWYRYHPSHLNLESSLELINKLKPKKSILTNLHLDLDYQKLKRRLPKNVVPAYDGLSVNL